MTDLDVLPNQLCLHPARRLGRLLMRNPSGNFAKAPWLKIVPKGIADHILPFNWDVRLVWEQEVNVSQRPIADFDYLLDLRLWSSVPNEGMLFDISPREVIASPGKAPHQERRILKADIRFPIDFLCYQGRMWILDGVHRLARLSLMGADSVNVRLHSEAIIPRITVLAEQGHGGNSVVCVEQLSI